MCTAMKVRRQSPHVLLVKVDCKQGTALGSEGGSQLGSTLLTVASRRRKKKYFYKPQMKLQFVLTRKHRWSPL